MRKCSICLPEKRSSGSAWVIPACWPTFTGPAPCNISARNTSRHSTHYDLLYPLLDITTDLDPKLVVAYEYGSVFLSQKPPDGAGQPDSAVALVEKGIRENPEYWRLYFNLGFIHYMDRHDPKAAQEAFLKGSEVPGALPWMKVMAARMAERSNDINTSICSGKASRDNLR